MLRRTVVFICICSLLPLLGQKQTQAPKAQFPETRLFGIILLQGTNQPQPSSAELPADTLKVLDEVSSFLPYKHFKLLDSSFIRSDRDASFRLNGPNKTSYTASMRFHSHPEEKDVLQVRSFEIFEITTRRDGTKLIPTRKDHIETSFSIKVGETIVVGTSRVDSDTDAVIVLFSAG